MCPMQVLKSNVFIIFLMAMALGLLSGTGRAGEKNVPEQGKKSALETIKKEFTHSKKISCDEMQNTYRMFYLDKDIYRHAREDLADLRVVDTAGETAPYYIDHGVVEYLKKDYTYTTKKISQRSNPKTGAANFDFQVIPRGETKRPAIHVMTLTVNSSSFSKQVVIYGRYEDTIWEELKRDTIYHFDSYKKSKIQAEGWDYSFYRIMIEDNREGLAVTKLSLSGSTGIRRKELLTDKTPLKYEQKQDGSKTIISMYNPDRLKIYHLSLAIKGTFRRRFRLYMEEQQYYKNSTQRPRTVQRNIAEGELYSFDFKNVKVSDTTISLYNYAMREQKLFLSIENNSDKPLEIGDIEAQYYKDRVVFKSSPGREYTLYFGNPYASQPVYDVASYRSYIDKEAKDMCTCEDIVSTEGEGDEDKGPLVSEDRLKVAFNVVIVLIALLLAFFLVRQLKSKK